MNSMEAQMRKTLKPLSKDRKMIVRNGNDDRTASAC